VLALIAFFVFNFISTKQKEALPITIKVENNDHVFGNPDSKVTLVEYADMQCPTCKAFDPIITTVTNDYKDKVKFVFKYFPLTSIHQNALLSATAVEAAANQGKFNEMKTLIFEKQEEWGGSLTANEKMIEYATVLGLDITKFKIDMNSADITERVMRDYRSGVEAGVKGTPTFYLNGKLVDLSDISTVDAFKKVLDAELAK
jgi:protein-disulfide isomerase